MPIGPLGWIDTLANADSFFATHVYGQKWSTYTNAEKTAYLTTAYQRIKAQSFNLSIPLEPTSGQLPLLQQAQCEMAIFIATLGIEGYSREAGIYQGVMNAGAVNESYKKPDYLPDTVKTILESFRKDRKAARVIDIWVNERKNQAYRHNVYRGY